MFSGSLVAIVTPMTPDGGVDYAAFERLIELHAEAGTAGLVIAGTTGESATLQKTEHVALIEAAVKFSAGRMPIIAGTGSNSTAQTVDLSRHVNSLPIDGFLIVTPYYNKPTPDGLVAHFEAVAAAVDKPIMLYNVPGRTAVDMLPETVARLASNANIFGIKEATGDVSRVAALRELCGEQFSLYSGDDATSREFMLAGGQGVVSVTSNVAPRAMAEMCRAAIAGDADRAAGLDAPLAALHADLFVEANPTPVKWALQRMGLIGGGIRLPLLPLSAAQQPVVEAALIQAGVLE